MFKATERLKPPKDLWQKIAAKSTLSSSTSLANKYQGLGFAWDAPLYKMVASLVLAVGLLGIGLYRKQHLAQVSIAGVLADSTFAKNSNSEFLDPDLLDWDADLGEVDWEIEDITEEVL
jgi:uncharacterized membrane protein YagU involved in acid resistance